MMKKNWEKPAVKDLSVKATEGIIDQPCKNPVGGSGSCPIKNRLCRYAVDINGRPWTEEEIQAGDFAIRDVLCGAVNRPYPTEPVIS